MSTEAFGKNDFEITFVITQETIFGRPPSRDFDSKGSNKQREERDMYQDGVQHIKLYVVIAF